MATPQREVRKRKRRERSSSKKRSWLAWVAVAVTGVALIIVIAVATWWITVQSEEHAIRDAIARGELAIVGVDLSWNLQRDSFTTSVHLLNTGELTVEGKLIFEISPQTDRLSRSYIAEVLAGSSASDRIERREALEGAPKLRAKDRALLAFLARGEITDNPDFETIPYEPGERPQDLSFRKTTPMLKIVPDQLAKVVVTQELPHSRMGEHVSLDSTRLIGIEF